MKIFKNELIQRVAIDLIRNVPKCGECGEYETGVLRWEVAENSMVHVEANFIHALFDVDMDDGEFMPCSLVLCAATGTAVASSEPAEDLLCIITTEYITAPVRSSDGWHGFASFIGNKPDKDEDDEPEQLCH